MDATFTRIYKIHNALFKGTFTGGESYDFDLTVQLENCFLTENHGGCFPYVIQLIVLLKQKCMKLLHIILLLSAEHFFSVSMS